MLEEGTGATGRGRGLPPYGAAVSPALGPVTRPAGRGSGSGTRVRRAHGQSPGVVGEGGNAVVGGGRARTLERTGTGARSCAYWQAQACTYTHTCQGTYP